MALGLAAAVANGFLNALARATNYTAPVGIFVQLHVGDPGAAGTSNPATETTRKAVTFGSVASGGSIANTVAVTWTNIAGTQDATNYSLWDAVSGGNFLGSGTITAAGYTAGDTYNMAIGAIVLAFGVAA
jgi:hypothetical protein